MTDEYLSQDRQLEAPSEPLDPLINYPDNRVRVTRIVLIVALVILICLVSQ